MKCFFVSDLHGKIDRYEKLFSQIKTDTPDILFIGGDILPHFRSNTQYEYNDFISDYLIPKFQNLKSELKNKYPKVFIILGNDDAKIEEPKVINGENQSLWQYIHNKKVEFSDYVIYGYANIPPTPFLLKDWERYDVSRYVDPGCVHPTDGKRTVIEKDDIEYSTIYNDLQILVGDDNLKKSIFLFHSPPYKTKLDRAALDGQLINHVPLDVHVGSIAIQRFIDERQPLLTLHGHIHESSRITGSWTDQYKNTYMFSAAYEFPDLAIVKFDLSKPDTAERIIL
jgi:Icc-related predicted phosphoesterase